MENNTKENLLSLVYIMHYSSLAKLRSVLDWAGPGGLRLPCTCQQYLLLPSVVMWLSVFSILVSISCSEGIRPYVCT